VIESKLDKKVGGIGSLLIQNGTLRVGDPIVVGTHFAKVRAMKNDKGEPILEAGPSSPVEITGLSGNPSAGDKFMAFETEAEAKKIAAERKACLEDEKNCKTPINLEDLFESIKEGRKEINIVLKADVRGCEEAIKSSLGKICVEGVTVKIVRSDIGPISESDIDLAIASDSIVIGFNAPASNLAVEKAKEKNIEIKNYDVIYKLIEDIELAMTGLLDPVFEEKELGKAEVRQIFTFSKTGNIAGSYVSDGLIKSGAMARVLRNNKVIGEAKIASIQRGKDQAKEVKKGFECGITLENYNDLLEKDIIECFEIIEVK
jgi:translation initiation factor IF-2